MDFPPAIPYFGFWWTALCLSLVVLVRYALFSGAAHLWLAWGPPSRDPSRWLGTAPPGQRAREIRYSIGTSLIFGGTGAILIALWADGVGVFRGSWNWTVGLQLLGLALVHETYFYWTHRLMHTPRWFPRLHRVHHLSRIPTPWAAFSFHPWEAVIQALALPLALILVPTHPATFLVYLTLMTVSGVVNHLGYEILPRGFAGHWAGKWWVGPTHHTMHHQRYRCNYGLYFTFWDHLGNTEAPDYPQVFGNTLELTRNDSPSVAT